MLQRARIGVVQGKAKHLLTAADEVDHELVHFKTLAGTGEESLRRCSAVRSNVEDGDILFLIQRLVLVGTYVGLEATTYYCDGRGFAAILAWTVVSVCCHEVHSYTCLRLAVFVRCFWRCLSFT
jgi:hypothetical protein